MKPEVKVYQNNYSKRWFASMSDLVGKTFTKVDGYDFVCEEGTFRFYHEQDCCENVDIYDIVGDLQDLVGTPILMAEEVEGESPVDYECHESCTWTFYKFATIKGYVDIRWLGESNGYYSESVTIEFIPK
jgi:hypothetical protein